jgi:hypothetical protein
MDIITKQPLIERLRLQELVSYLRLSNWLEADRSKKWLVFSGVLDVAQKHIEIVLPRDDIASDTNVYITSAVNTLSALAKESIERTVKRVKNFDRDVLNVRNLEVSTSESDSIPLQLASEQVYELKQLVSYSASSEYDPRPHFEKALAIGNNMVEHYRFGHTFAGSFGFTIEAPITSTIVTYHRLFKEEDQDEDVTELPLERRVMERIVRGLISAQQATQQDSARALIDSYTTGFNSRMCDAIVKMSKNKTMPIEYDVLWSPKLTPSEDIRDIGPIQTAGRNYTYLEQAASVLKRLEPSHETITGVVIALSSKDDPVRVSDAERAVVIEWRDRPGRPRMLIVRLNPEDYVAAHQAHINWYTVKVSGIVVPTSKIWKLSEAHNFQVIK